jgi:predicted DNA-binding transcriptional regulator AlpA
VPPDPLNLRDHATVGVDVIAELLSCSPRSVWRLERAGKIPAGQRITSRMVRWSADEIAAWLDAGRPPRDEWVHRWEAIRAQRKGRLQISQPLAS